MSITAEATEFSFPHRHLLGIEPGNPVIEQFRVKSLPTMYLIGANSEIVMYHDGGLTGNDWRVLEQEIRARLNVPANVPLSF